LLYYNAKLKCGEVQVASDQLTEKNVKWEDLTMELKVVNLTGENELTITVSQSFVA
jgi:hypothetical protein